MKPAGPIVVGDVMGLMQVALLDTLDADAFPGPFIEGGGMGRRGDRRGAVPACPVQLGAPGQSGREGRPPGMRIGSGPGSLARSMSR